MLFYYSEESEQPPIRTRQPHDHQSGDKRLSESKQHTVDTNSKYQPDLYSTKNCLSNTRKNLSGSFSVI